VAGFEVTGDTATNDLNHEGTESTKFWDWKLGFGMAAKNHSATEQGTKELTTDGADHTDGNGFGQRDSVPDSPSASFVA
jgi:hypothetical protein